MVSNANQMRVSGAPIVIIDRGTPPTTSRGPNLY